MREIQRNMSCTLNRSSVGKNDLALDNSLDKRTGSLLLKPYTLSSSLSPTKETEVSNLAMLACIHRQRLKY